MKFPSDADWPSIDREQPEPKRRKPIEVFSTPEGCTVIRLWPAPKSEPKKARRGRPEKRR
ncbi:hypothetical protein [Labilithrix luteola]|uniref:hypothetical protein n=1 Tax=Labilithrix luteola TaxID=1391654 RepID=UPI0011BA6A7D|nr:hypothetical protein [Labilithrix luteola]